MFAIYNIEGRRFRDNLENLKRVHSPHKADQVSFHENIAQDETVIIQGNTTEKVNSQGLETYRKMLHGKQRHTNFSCLSTHESPCNHSTYGYPHPRCLSSF